MVENECEMQEDIIYDETEKKIEERENDSFANASKCNKGEENIKKINNESNLENKEKSFQEEEVQDEPLQESSANNTKNNFDDKNSNINNEKINVEKKESDNNQENDNVGEANNIENLNNQKKEMTIEDNKNLNNELIEENPQSNEIVENNNANNDNNQIKNEKRENIVNEDNGKNNNYHKDGSQNYNNRYSDVDQNNNNQNPNDNDYPNRKSSQTSNSENREINSNYGNKQMSKTCYDKAYPRKSNSSKTNKSDKKDIVIPKSNPAYLYYRELQRMKENIKKRTQTAKYQASNYYYKMESSIEMRNPYKTSHNFNKFNKTGFSTNSENTRYKGFGNNLEKKHQKMINSLNDPKNPYSTYWSGKILEKNFNLGISVRGFLNGVPVLNFSKKKNDSLLNKNFYTQYNNSKTKSDTFNNTNNNYSENTGQNNKNNEYEAENGDDINPEMDAKFNTNQNNFFQVRKDIQEEPIENEIDNDGNNNIQFSEIYKYFDNNQQ